MEITELRLYKKLKKFYINLDHRKDRQASMEAQFKGDFIRKSAVYGAECSLDFLEQNFDIQKNRDAYNIVFYANQMACTLSHYQIYQDIVVDDSLDDNDWVLIAEDDSFYPADFAQRLENVLQHLKDPCYQEADLVLLKLFQLEEDLDYAPYLPLLGCKSKRSQDEQTAKNISILKQRVIHLHIRTNKSRINDISYTIDGKKHPQHLLTSTFFRPYAASLYLIRKRRCRKIIEQKPWWFADDFKKIVPLHRTLFVSPFLALEHETSKTSSLNNQYASIIHRWNKLTTGKEFLYFTILKLFNINLFSPDSKLRQKSLARVKKFNLDF